MAHLNKPLFCCNGMVMCIIYTVTLQYDCVDVIYRCVVVPMYHVDTLEVSQSFTDLQTEQGQSHIVKCALVVCQVLSQLMKTRRKRITITSDDNATFTNFHKVSHLSELIQLHHNPHRILFNDSYESHDVRMVQFLHDHCVKTLS